MKGSPYPRSYYKCTEKNCPVKKQVEQCGPMGGTIINTYEGTHNHLAPGLEENPRKRRRRRKSSPSSVAHQGNLASTLGEYGHDDPASAKRRKYQIENEDEHNEGESDLVSDESPAVSPEQSDALSAALSLHHRLTNAHSNKISAHLRQFPPLGSPAASPFGMGLGVNISNAGDSVYAVPQASSAAHSGASLSFYKSGDLKASPPPPSVASSITPPLLPPLYPSRIATASPPSVSSLPMQERLYEVAEKQQEKAPFLLSAVPSVYASNSACFLGTLPALNFDATSAVHPSATVATVFAPSSSSTDTPLPQNSTISA